MKKFIPALVLFLAGLMLPLAGVSAAVTPAKAAVIKVTILSTMLADLVGIGEWGFAALIEVDGYKVLFDTGARPETVLRNAEELKIDLSQVTDVILSHNHDDARIAATGAQSRRGGSGRVKLFIDQGNKSALAGPLTLDVHCKRN